MDLVAVAKSSEKVGPILTLSYTLITSQEQVEKLNVIKAASPHPPPFLAASQADSARRGRSAQVPNEPGQ